MEVPEIVIAILALIACVLSIATGSIGIKALNMNKEYRDKNKPNFGFILFNLIIAIIIACVALFDIILIIKNKLSK